MSLKKMLRLWIWLNMILVGSQRSQHPKNVEIEPIIDLKWYFWLGPNRKENNGVKNVWWKVPLEGVRHLTANVKKSFLNFFWGHFPLIFGIFDKYRLWPSEKNNNSWCQRLGGILLKPSCQPVTKWEGKTKPSSLMQNLQTDEAPSNYLRCNSYYHFTIRHDRL